MSEFTDLWNTPLPLSTTLDTNLGIYLLMKHKRHNFYNSAYSEFEFPVAKDLYFKNTDHMVPLAAQMEETV